MNVVDSSAWLAYLAGEKNAGYFAAAIQDTANLVVPTVCLSRNDAVEKKPPFGN